MAMAPPPLAQLKPAGQRLQLPELPAQPAEPWPLAVETKPGEQVHIEHVDAPSYALNVPGEQKPPREPMKSKHMPPYFMQV